MWRVNYKDLGVCVNIKNAGECPRTIRIIWISPGGQGVLRMFSRSHEDIAVVSSNNVIVQ